MAEPTLDRLRRMRIYEEPAGSATFGIDNSANLATQFFDVWMKQAPSPTKRTVAREKPDSTRQRKDAHDLEVHGPRSWTTQFDTVLSSHGTDVNGVNTPPSSTSAPKWALGMMNKISMGGERIETPPGAPTLVVAGSTTTVINVTATHGARFPKSSAIACIVNNRIEVREVLSRSTDAISVKVAFSGIPGTGSAVRGGVTYHLTEDPLTSAQFVEEGKDLLDRYVMTGGQVTGVTLSVQRGKIPMKGFSWAGELFTKLGSSALAVASHPHYNPIVAKDSEFLVATVGSTTRNLVHWGSSSWTPGIKYLDHPSPAGVETVTRKVRDRVVPVLTVKFTVSKDSAGLDWESFRDNDTSIALFQQLGIIAGKIVFLSAPTTQVVDVQPASNAGFSGWEVTCESREDESGVAFASDFEASAYRETYL